MEVHRPEDKGSILTLSIRKEREKSGYENNCPWCVIAGIVAYIIKGKLSPTQRPEFSRNLSYFHFCRVNSATSQVSDGFTCCGNNKTEHTLHQNQRQLSHSTEAEVKGGDKHVTCHPRPGSNSQPSQSPDQLWVPWKNPNPTWQANWKKKEPNHYTSTKAGGCVCSSTKDSISVS